MHNPDYKSLKIWQLAMDLTTKVYQKIKNLPKEETYGLSDQIRRAVVSIPSNIAEGCGRSSTKDFLNFLHISQGSLFELDTQLLICINLGYLQEDEVKDLFDKVEYAKLSISKFIAYHKSKLK